MSLYCARIIGGWYQLRNENPDYQKSRNCACWQIDFLRRASEWWRRVDHGAAPAAKIGEKTSF